MKRALLLIVLTSGLFHSYAQGWKWGAGSTTTAGILESSPIVIDKSGNVYETGSASGGTDTMTSYFGSFVVVDSSNMGNQGILVSTDSNGVYRWVLGTQNGAASFSGIQIDQYGNLYILGQAVSDSFTFGSILYGGGAVSNFCVKINASGDVLWIKELSPGYNSTVIAIAVSNSGSIYIGGMFGFGVPTLTIGGTTLTNSYPSTFDVFFAKFDSSCNPLWAKSFGGYGNEYLTSLCLDSDSDVFVAGNFSTYPLMIGADTLTGYLAIDSLPTMYIAKFNDTGGALWAKAVNPTDTSAGNLNSITTDGSGNVYITGAYTGSFIFGTTGLPITSSSGNYAMFLAKYDPLGDPRWAKTLETLQQGWYVTTDACGNIWVSGPTVEDPTYINDSMTIAEIDSSGTWKDSIYLIVGGDDYSGLVADNHGNLYIGGDYMRSFFIDTSNFNDPLGIETLFVLKYMYDTVLCIPSTTQTQNVEKYYGSGINIYPNPAVNECFISNPAGFPAGSKAELYDINGRLVNTFLLFSTSTTLSVAGITPGVYQCNIMNGDKIADVKKLVIVK